ncbi:hypothetical protein GGR56DRAFT_464727 [Xylariaceae sp. FL0804]|nr:hypothetical protein GGR56DRAFT_464727 [Xylariaceae sp. FL0804]
MSSFRYSDINFDDPEPVANRPATIYGVVITFMLMTWICVLLRLHVRFRVVHAAGWDDLYVVLYLLTVTVGTIAICLAVRYGGLGKHFLLLDQPTREAYLKTFYVANATYITSTAFIKAALLLQYLRIFDPGTVTHRLIKALIIFVALWGFAYSFLGWVPCFPVWEFWIADAGARCYGFGSADARAFVATFESHTAINMVLDLLVLFLPLPLYWRANTTPAARLRLTGLMAAGTLVIVFATWRLVTIIRHQAATYPTRDPTWYGPLTILLAVLEVDAAAICASVPVFWPVLTLQWGKIFVTQEIVMTRETRYSHHPSSSSRHDDDMYEDVYEDDENGLTRGSSSNPSSGQSRGEEAQMESGGDPARYGKDGHYKDSYVLAQLDPLRAQTEGIVTSATRAGGNIGKKGGGRKWTRI